MGIFDRMGKVISSNINALLDKADDPRKSIELTIDEMAQSLREAKQEIVEALGTQKRLGTKLDEIDKEVEKWDRRAELALKADDEELAREALKQKKRLVEDRDRAEGLRAEQRGVVLNMKKEMERMEHKLKELKARKGTIAGEIAKARKGNDPLATSGPGGKAFDKFREMEDKIETQRSEADAHSEVDEVLNQGLSEAQLEQKFAQLEGRGGGEGGGSAAIDDEIAKLKQKLRIEK